jgi:hypothetical protein
VLCHDLEHITSAISPQIGGPSTTFEFTIVYTPKTPPTAATVVIDGTPYTMTPTGTSKVVPVGTIYSYATKLAPGNHSVSFSFTNNGQTQVLPFNGVEYGVPVMPFDVTDVSPKVSALLGTPQIFAADYVATSGNPPTIAEVDIDGQTHAMSLKAGTTTTYQYVANGLSTGQHYHRFRFSDGTNTGVYESEPGQFISPFVLSAAKCSPKTGTASTVFTFTVDYTHYKGVAPTQAFVYVDDTPHSLTLVSGTPKTRAVYSAQLTLPVGSHSFFFLFNDGTTMLAQPMGKPFTGPTVT